MDAAQALADLTEISSQIRAAVLLDGQGGVEGSTFADIARARRMAESAQALLAAAEDSDGRPLAQLEAATLGGSVFVVRDGARTIAATTTPEPTVGLVFYDLKSCLRAAAGEEKPRPKPRRKTPPKEQEERDAEA